jgi:thiamine biosynthesis protein ThiI
LKPNLLLVAYSEIALKSPPVRRRLENMLLSQIKAKLSMAGLPAEESWKEGGRIFLKHENAESAAAIASKIFGVEYAAPAVQASTRIEDLISMSVKLVEGKLKEGLSFAVRARRVGSHPYTSRELEAQIGKAILESYKNLNLKVNLESPQLTLHVEAREQSSYLYVDVFRGFGGLPAGSQGKALTVFDGWRAALASWLTMKRGVNVAPLTLGLNREESSRSSEFFKALIPWITRRKIKVYTLTLAETSRWLAEKNFCSPVFQELAKALAAIEAARNLGFQSLILGLTLKPNPVFTIRLLKLLRESLGFLFLTPLMGLEESKVLEVAEVLGLKPKNNSFFKVGSREFEVARKIKGQLLTLIRRDLENLSFYWLKIA